MQIQEHNYDKLGHSYSKHRVPDPNIDACILHSLKGHEPVLNVGAGTGSYEPLDRDVIAIEPSATMRIQRPKHLAPAIACLAELMPFKKAVFGAAMAILTVHHWPQIVAGLKEMRRVTKGPVVIMTFDPDADSEFWLTDYVPEMKVVGKGRYPSIDIIREGLGGNVDISPVPVTKDCTDKFQAALYARPEEFLIDEVRRSQSDWSYLPADIEKRFVRNLKGDLGSGEWDRKYRHFRTQPSIRSQLRLIISNGRG